MKRTNYANDRRECAGRGTGRGVAGQEKKIAAGGVVTRNKTLVRGNAETDLEVEELEQKIAPGTGHH